MPEVFLSVVGVWRVSWAEGDAVDSVVGAASVEYWYAV